MIPVQFGVGTRPLLGIYTPAVEPRRRRGVVICNPWGGEALRAHRAIRLLADLLARDGHDVLRFDYSGTGDSFGNTEAIRLADWVEDAECAVEEVQSAAGVQRVAIVGLRLGSWVAATAAARRPEAVERVVLWEPMFDGTDHLRELLAGARQTRETTGTMDVAGFPLTAAFRADLAAATLAGLPGLTFRVLVADTAGDGAGPGAGPAGLEVARVSVAAAPCWVEEREFGAGAVPVDLLRGLTAWLA